MMKPLRLVPGTMNDSVSTSIRRAASSGDQALHFPGRRGADGCTSDADHLLRLIDTMSRRIDDLARELNCFVPPDPGDDRPRAA